MSFEEAVARCGAPALCGIKPSCLFSIRNELYNGSKVREWNSSFARDGRRIVALSRKRPPAPMLCFVYDRALLERRCADRAVRRYLKEKGYPVDAGFYATLAELLHRLSADVVFPHEVGVFLGYPLEDVIQFERTAGGGCRYAGFWKVYGDVDAARKQMSAYRACGDACHKSIKDGLSVPKAVKKFLKK